MHNKLTLNMSSEDRKFYFSENDFVYNTSWQEPICITKFDEYINTYWNTAMDKNYFRFKLNIVGSKQLQGKFGFTAQLHPDRGLKRRPPMGFETMDEPFNPDTFNFTKIPDREVILQLIREGEICIGKDAIAINDSPLSASHCLILPQIDKMLPQAMTLHATKLALYCLLLSANPSVRIGFNSLCGFASVNHLHLHRYLLPDKMVLETIPLKKLAGPCYELDEYAVKGFCFESEPQNCDDISTLARHTHKLTSFLQDRKIGHNINWTRSGQSHALHERRKVRVYVWVRQYSSAKASMSLSPALCEFFGLLVYKTEDDYNNSTEESVCKLLDGVTSSCFDEVRSAVRDLFRENDTLCNTSCFSGRS